jgi:sulfite reductase (ferredoxin)
MSNETKTTRPNIAGEFISVRDEIEQFRGDLARYESGKISDTVFLENRLRFGVYGQRQDGAHMMRSKIPLGLLSATQLEVFADVAERFGNGNAHLTTRQGIQTHFVRLSETPDFMHVLNSEQMTAREACGNVVRNITASPIAGVSPTEAFDVTPYGMALAQFLLRHPDAQSLGRKIKVTLSGDSDARFNLGAFHDIGLTAKVRDGVRGFRFLVGGGLGPVPHEALVYSEFIPAREIFPIAVAILRIFGVYGEKKNRARARLKFLVAKWGIEKFRHEIDSERSLIADDPEWDRLLSDAALATWTDAPTFAPAPDFPVAQSDEEAGWLRTNVIRQRQEGFASVVVRVPKGDLNPEELRSLAAVVRGVAGEDTVRVGLDQSLFIRWVPFDRLLQAREALEAIGLGGARAGGLGDTVTCPGADTCKLGITSPRALGRSIQETLDDLADDERLERLRIHVSGCPNSCAQTQIADIGWFGAARSVSGVSSPHYMLVLGGRAGGAPVDGGDVGSGFGNIVTKIPAFRVGEATRALAELYLEEGAMGERFGDLCRRLGFPRIKKLLADFRTMPTPEEAPWAFREPGSQESFAVVRGVGECAGEPVERSDFLLTDAERESDAAVELLEEGGAAARVAEHAHKALELAARALLSTEHKNDLTPEQVAAEFKISFYDRGRIFEGVGHYFLSARGEDPEAVSGDRLRRLAVEAGLFVEEANSIIARMRTQAPSPLVKLEVRP